MIVETGHFALVLALCIAAVQATIPMIGAHLRNQTWMSLAVPAALTQFLLLVVSFAALTHAFVTSDFSVLTVVNNSHTLKPMLYKVSGVWGNHEGSMLMWVLILAVYGAAVAFWGNNLRPTLKARVLAIQGLLGVPGQRRMPGDQLGERRSVAAVQLAAASGGLATPCTPNGCTPTGRRYRT